MDIVQKRKILLFIYKLINFLTILCLGWAVYLSVDKILKANNFLVIDVFVFAIAFLFLLIMLIDVIKTHKLKNKYSLAVFLILIATLYIVLVIGGSFYAYYKVINVGIGYIFAVSLTFVSLLLTITNFIIGINIYKSFNKNVELIDSSSETPTYDDELNLQKQVDELNRKLEMKKVQEKIIKLQEELDGEDNKK